ncbi:MAG: transporter substrate-binding domain-containing protein [Methylocystaceae bacterium]|nr:transporter substrate-binding domain-containing protein [Methylocystaceae bacterium]
MYSLIAYILCLLVFVSINTKTAQASDVAMVYTSYFARTVEDNPDRPGFAYELVTSLFKQAGLKAKIEPLPWARSQYMAQNTPEALIFPLSWTPTRDSKYSWSLLLFKNHTHFITYKHPKMDAEIARKRSIGVQLKSSWDNWLTEQGYENIYRVPGDGSSLIKLLRNDRIDAWFTDQIIGNGVTVPLKDPGFTYSDPIQTFNTYLATNKQQPYPHMDKLVKAYKEIRASGRLNEIFTKYDIRNPD